MNLFKKEKKQLTPIRRIVNYVVIPIYAAICASALITGGCLIAIDEERYTAVFLALAGFILLLSAALLISLPFIRKKEALIEAAKYDFDFQSVEKKESYSFEQHILVGTAETQPSPFDDLTNKTVAVKGATKVNEILNSLHAGEIMLEAFLDEISPFICDLTDDCEFTHYEIEKANDGKVYIYENNCLSFEKDCACVNEEKFPYSTVKATVNSIAVLHHVKLSVIFEFSNIFCATTTLDKEIIAIIKQFNISVTNDGALELLLTDKNNAFEQVLKYGKIKKY